MRAWSLLEARSAIQNLHRSKFKLHAILNNMQLKIILQSQVLGLWSILRLKILVSLYLMAENKTNMLKKVWMNIKSCKFQIIWNIKSSENPANLSQTQILTARLLH